MLSTQQLADLIKKGKGEAKERKFNEAVEEDKQQAKKVARSYDFFLADTALMTRIGKILGQSLGPRGKIPIPVPPTAPIETMIQRMRTAIRVRSRGSLGIAAKVGERKLTDSELAENVLAVVQAVEKKLPQGEKNIKSVIVKTTMGKPVKQAVGQR